MPAPLLVLFDVDGTLLLTPDPLMGRAVVETLEQVYGVALSADAVERIDHAGQTNKHIGRLVLEQARVDAETIDARLDAWRARSAERYLELLAGSSTDGWEARPGWPTAKSVEVGDTCRDVETAHDAGVRSIVFASGRSSRDRLAAADAVVETMPELLAVLAEL